MILEREGKSPIGKAFYEMTRSLDSNLQAVEMPLDWLLRSSSNDLVDRLKADKDGGKKKNRKFGDGDLKQRYGGMFGKYRTNMIYIKEAKILGFSY